MKELLGEVNVSMCYVDSTPCLALVDTGSQVTTISEDFYKECLSSNPMQQLEDILKIEGAGGQNVPFLGFIEVDISFPEETSGMRDCLTAIVLVVQNTSFNKQVPMVIGTNVVRRCKEFCVKEYGNGFIQRGKPDLAWRLAYQCLTHRDRKINKLLKSSTIRSATEKPCVVHPNETVVLWTSTKTRKADVTCPALIENTSNGIAELQIIPTVVNLKMDGSRNFIPVKIHNNTTKDVTIPPKTVVCSLQQVSVADTAQQPDDSTVARETEDLCFDFGPSPMNSEQKEVACRVLEEWKDRIFSQGPNDHGCTSAVKHTIPLSDEIPFKQRHRRIPPSQYDEVRNHLSDMLDCGVIRESHSPYSSPVVLARKRDGSLRFCIDYRKLNSKTIKDAYALPRMDEALEAMGGCSWFTTLDLKSGYYQIEV